MQKLTCFLVFPIWNDEWPVPVDEMNHQFQWMRWMAGPIWWDETPWCPKMFPIPLHHLDRPSCCIIQRWTPRWGVVILISLTRAGNYCSKSSFIVLYNSNFMDNSPPPFSVIWKTSCLKQEGRKDDLTEPWMSLTLTNLSSIITTKLDATVGGGNMTLYPHLLW